LDAEWEKKGHVTKEVRTLTGQLSQEVSMYVCILFIIKTLPLNTFSFLDLQAEGYLERR
jgi:hypothetical protein